MWRKGSGWEVFREELTHWRGCSSGKEVHTEEDVLPGIKSTHTPGRRSTQKG